MSCAAGTALVIVASTSAAAGTAPDTTGPVVVDWLRARGFDTRDAQVVADGEDVGRAVDAALSAQHAVVLTTGGTGVSPSDRTPEAVTPYLDRELPGILEEVRRRGAPHVPTAVLTRGVAGFAGDTFVMTLPGSHGGVSDSLAVLEPILDHLLAQHAGTSRAGDGHGPRA